MSEGIAARLGRLAPVAPELQRALARFQGLGVLELERALAERDEALRDWARAHPGRPVREAPCHLERVAIGALLEHRLSGE